MVYAQLIHSQLAAVLNFLCSVPGPTGESALHFVLTEWLSRQHVFYGAYENKVASGFYLGVSQFLRNCNSQFFILEEPHH